ncbi:hypothetical protein J8M20_08895 [Pseudoalteromonas luteoviolacea]|uniref:hypothetical protein n=1 Tax=Pseudoalteromonas luteoviolacea TaxID=43657 RepID=UPI001B366E40|nr:hypothetical protein [Pseudoalteromonas luteoviolacea]MBQ4811453.1 hypothetical protein [Pseudoalteromonas luteoviolacea]
MCKQVNELDNFEDEMDIFNYVGNESTLTHQNVNSLLRISLSDTNAPNADALATAGRLDTVILGGETLDESLRDAILKFLGQNEGTDQASFACVRGYFAGREITGDTHWTGLHLRLVDGQLYFFYVDSGEGAAIHNAIPRVIANLRIIQIANLGPELQNSDIYQTAVNRIVSNNVTLNDAVLIPVQTQKDWYSCGYHAVFNLMAMDALDNPTAITPNLNMEDLEINVAGVNLKNREFITNQRDRLQAEFNGYVGGSTAKKKKSTSGSQSKKQRLDILKPWSFTSGKQQLPNIQNTKDLRSAFSPYAMQLLEYKALIEKYKNRTTEINQPKNFKFSNLRNVIGSIGEEAFTQHFKDNSSEEKKILSVKNNIDSVRKNLKLQYFDQVSKSAIYRLKETHKVIIGYEIEVGIFQADPLPSHYLLLEEDSEEKLKVRLEVDKGGSGSGVAPKTLELVLPPVTKDVSIDTLTQILREGLFFGKLVDKFKVCSSKIEIPAESYPFLYPKYTSDRKVNAMDMNIASNFTNLSSIFPMTLKKFPTKSKAGSYASLNINVATAIELFMDLERGKSNLTSGAPLLKTHPLHLVGMIHPTRRSSVIEFAKSYLINFRSRHPEADKMRNERIDSLIRGLNELEKYKDHEVALLYMDLINYVKKNKSEKNILPAAYDVRYACEYFFGHARIDVLVVPFQDSDGTPMVVLEYRQLNVLEAKKIFARLPK